MRANYFGCGRRPRHELAVLGGKKIPPKAVNLKYIGWGPRAAARSIEPPGQPMRLESIDEGAGTLLIEWKRPVRGSGEPVRTYIIERRDLTIDEMGDDGGIDRRIGRGNKWKQTAISLETRASLKDQLRGL